MRTECNRISGGISVRDALLLMSDDKYRNFSAGLIPNIPPERIIGVRAPDLRGLEKRIRSSAEAVTFLAELPHLYHEEDYLHALLINSQKDFDITLRLLEDFLPFVDNWAICDAISPACFARNKDKLLEKIREWIKSEHTYTVRFALKMLMTHFLDHSFKVEYHEMASGVDTDEYYLMMMKAWYFATALAKQYCDTLPYLEEYRLDKRTHNKTIQKAIESYRVDTKAKEYLKTLRR